MTRLSFDLLPVPRIRMALRQSTAITRIAGVLLLALVTCSTSHGDFQAVKVGDPVFELSSVGTSPEPFGSSTTLMLDILGPTHPRDPSLFFMLPGTPHDGPYGQHIREQIAAHGLVNTDVFTANELRRSRGMMGVTTLVPSDNAPSGPSPDGTDGPVIPNDIFPITVTREGILHNGRELFGRVSFRFKSLEDLGTVTFCQRGHCVNQSSASPKWIFW